MKVYSWHTGDTWWDGYKVEDGEPWEFERRLWDEKMANVRDAVTSDAVDMDGAWDAWRECLEEYARMPTAWELSEATEGNGRG